MDLTEVLRQGLRDEKGYGVTFSLKEDNPYRMDKRFSGRVKFGTESVTDCNAKMVSNSAIVLDGVKIGRARVSESKVPTEKYYRFILEVKDTDTFRKHPNFHLGHLEFAKLNDMLKAYEENGKDMFFEYED